MALVYRVIPIPEASYMEQGFIGTCIQTPEKEFYDLGYLDFPKNMPYFKLEENSNTFERPEPETETKAFFLFPLHALYASRWIERFDGYYSSSSVWLCEYEIPNDILIEYLGFGYYRNVEIPEFQIPIDELCAAESMMTECDDDTFKALRKRYQFNVEAYVQASLDLSDEKIQARYNRLLDRLDKNFEARTGKNKGIFFPNDIITGRSFVARRSDIDKAWYKGEKESLIISSNGIITEETFAYLHDYIKQANEHGCYTAALNSIKSCVKKKSLVKPE